MKNLTEISRAVAKIHGVSNAKALDITRTVIDCIKKGVVELEKGSRDRVALAEFGNFAVKATNPRTVRNIRTGEAVEVPASVRIIFKPADVFKKQVASGEFDLTVPERGTKAEESEEPEEKKPAEKKPRKKKAETIDDEEIPDLDDLENM